MLYLKQILKIISLIGITNKVIYSKHRKKLISILLLLTFSLYFISKNTGQFDICNMYCTNCSGFYDNVINNNIDPKYNIFEYTSKKKNINENDYQIHAYRFATGVELLIKNLANSGVNFQVITIAPDLCITTTLRYTLHNCDHPMCYYVLQRQESMLSTWSSKNVQSTLIIDTQHKKENNEDKFLEKCNNGIGVYNVLHKQYSNIITHIHNDGYDDFAHKNHFRYGIYWLIRFTGDNNVYEIHSTQFLSGGHQIDFINTSKIGESNYSFHKKTLQQFQDEETNPFIVYLTKNAPKGKLSNFLK